MTLPEITSICSIIIAIAALYYTRTNYLRQVREEVKVRIFAYDNPYKIEWTIKSRKDPEQRLYLATQWECVIINNGEKSVTITNWTVSESDRFNVVPYSNQLFQIKIAGASSPADFHKIIEVHKNVYTIEVDQEIPLPISIASGNSITFKIKIGLYIRSDIQEMVQLELNEKRMGDNTQEIFQFLQNKELWLDPPNVDQLIPVTFKTAKGHYFSDIAFFNKAERF